MPESHFIAPDADILQVLVVDDEPVLIEEIIEFLESEGLAATAANNAETALLRLAQAAPGAFTVVLTDVRMPGLDGLSLARDILRPGSDAHAVEVIIMTGHANFGMAVDALRSRVFDFIRKPLHLAELADIIRRAHAAAMARRRRHHDNAEALARLRAEAQSLSARIAELSARPIGPDGRATSAFLHILSDELRNPLVPIISLADLIEASSADLPPRQLAEYARLIRTAGERLTQLIDAMLNVAGLEAGAPQCQPRPQDAGQIVAMLASGHSADAQEHGQTIHAHPPADIVVTTDRRYLLMALDQLVSNAIRFGPKGQTVRIEAEAAGSEVAFRVIDSGPGMTEAELAEMRKPFRQGNTSVPRVPAGLGLGLSLAERSVAALGGRFELTSVPGRGTTAAIVLPATAAHSG